MTSIRTRYLPDEEAQRLYEDHPWIKPSYEDYCPTCEKKNKNTYIWKGVQHECDCELQLQLHKWYLTSGIGVNYQRLDWADWNGDDSLIESLSSFVFDHQKYVSKGMGLLLTGDFGTGKTMLATLTLKEYIKLGYSCYSTTFANTIEMFTAGWYNDEDKKRFQRKFVQSEVLLLDDLGRELKTKNNLAETTFDNILRTRVQHGRSTFITTNLHPSELGEGYGGAVLSLLTEKSVHQGFEGSDYRPQAQKRELMELKSGETRPIV